MVNENPKSALSRRLITSLIKKSTKVVGNFSVIVKKHGVTIQQFNVLRILRGRKGESATLNDVSKDMIHANSNTTRLIDKLVEKKLVVRSQNSNDRRQIELSITSTGLELLNILDDKIEEIESSLTENFDDQSMEEFLLHLDKL